MDRLSRKILIILLLGRMLACSGYAEEVVFVQTESSSASIKDIYPESEATDDIQLDWIVSGVSYGLRFDNHFFELRFLSSEYGGLGRVDPFFIQGEASSNEKRIKKISEDIKVRVLGLYYSPAFGPGFIYGLGYEEWHFMFDSLTIIGQKEMADSEEFETEITTVTPIIDLGYQLGDDSLIFILKARMGIPKKLIMNLNLGYQF